MPTAENIDSQVFFKSGLRNATKYVGGKSKPKNQLPIHKLSSNENPMGPSPMALEAIHSQLGQLHEYPDNDDRRLRNVLSDFYLQALSADHFISGPSASELIEIILRGFIYPGDEIIICSPTFLPYRVFAEKLDGVVIDVPLLTPNFSLDVHQILSAITEKTKLIFLGSPNNPTGQIVDDLSLNELTNGMPSHVILVLDEVYHHFVTEQNYSTALPFTKAGKNVIGLNSFSKAYGLAGLRLGYAYAPRNIAAYLRLLCKPFQLSNMAIDAGIAALHDTGFIDRVQSLIIEERSYLQKNLKDHPLRFWPSQGNFVLFKLQHHHAKNFEEKMLKHGVMIRPVRGEGFESYYRVSIGKRDAMDAFLSALRQCLS